MMMMMIMMMTVLMMVIIMITVPMMIFLCRADGFSCNTGRHGYHGASDVSQLNWCHRVPDIQTFHFKKQNNPL
jgi:hypothetical protein